MEDKPQGPAIRNVSDTARWVAFYRAMESERPDAIFRDPYARRLAGQRGEQIVGALRGGRRQAWSMVTRTALIDLTLARVMARETIDMVVNLAAGLDARPYRLDLPPALQWVEIDLPEMIEYKSEILAQESPRCRLERVALDLALEAARRAVFARLNASCQAAFLITEGLLAYLSEEQVAGLARDLHDREHFRYWITDLASPKVRQMMQRYWGKQLKAANAPFQFAPESGEGFFRPQGWEAVEFNDLLTESRRLDRPMPMDWLIRAQAKLFPRRTEKQMKLWRSGVVLLRRV